MKREWKLGIDLFTFNSILDEVTFDELIKTIQCNCKEITPEAVKKEFYTIMKSKLNDAYDLLERNINEIISEVNERRN